MTFRKRRTEELVGESLHGELAPQERAELQKLLAADPSLRSDAQQLADFVNRIPATPIEFQGDLRPALEAELARRSATRGVLFSHRTLAAAAFLIVASGVAYWIAAFPPAAVAPQLAESMDSRRVQIASSPLLDQAGALVAERRFAEAYAILAGGLRTAPRAGDAALACQKMAALAFEELKWYPEALDGYDRLRRDYNAQFRADPDNFERLNLLDEARGPASDFASLRALDAARRDGTIENFEKILARYPATYVASAAADDLALVVARDEGLAPGAFDSVAALRRAQQRVTDPVARMQLRIEVAHALRDDPAQREEARREYRAIAGGPFTALAELAQKSLDAIDAPGSTEAPRL